MTKSIESLPKSTDIRQALTGKQLSVIRKENGEGPVIGLLVKVISSCMEWGADKSLMIAEMILEDYWYLRMEELKFLLKRGLRGHYGPVPKDANPLLYWVKRYDEEERMKHLEAEALRHKEPQIKLARKIKSIKEIYNDKS